MKTKRGYYTIGVVANLFHITPQTLRLYEEKGFITPSRSRGNKRLYHEDDLERLELVLKLTRDMGVNLAGVEIILNLREKMLDMEKRYKEVVELLFKEFQDVKQKDRHGDEEGLIACASRNLVRIRKPR